ncbi:hypothetical protein BCI9360_00313 [Bacillus sp. CECT 9360]|nr:hypothetical protein BCI9360_00313 [Bacillus sp. CECT 9360]
MKWKKGRYYYFITRLMMSKQAVVNKIVTYKQQVFTESKKCKRFINLFCRYFCFFCLEHANFEKNKNNNPIFKE